MAKLCLMCHQPIPENLDYPKFFGQNKLSPNLTNLADIAEETETIVGYLDAICNVLITVEEATMREGPYLTLGHLAGELAEEAQRRLWFVCEAGMGKTTCGKEG